MAQRFRRGTKGYNGEVFVGPAVAVSAVANYKEFADATTPMGQIAVFDANTNLIITTALTEGQEFFIAQRRSSPAGTVEIKKSSSYVYYKKGALAVDYVAPVKDAWTVTLPGYTPKAGDEITIKAIETADESQVPPTFSFTYRVKAADTLTTIYAGLALAVNNYPAAVGVGDDLFVTATSSAAGLVLTEKFEQASFRVATPGLSYDYAVVANSTKAVYGSGFYDEIWQLEFEGEVFDGVTTQYPGGTFVPSDFGTTPRYAVAGTQYAKFQLNTYKNEYSPTPVNQHHHLKHLTIVAVQAGALYTALNVIFGFVEAGG